jgi:putative transcriptional regulator
MAYNIVTADFTNSSDVGITGELWQWDYGQILHVTGLPEIYAHEVHFSNKPITGKAKAIRFSTLEKICRVLDCQPGDILAYKEDK